ncbi:MAG: hypothetical protein J5995_01845 [Muribaculaceae bacterium]|nr:hypothetical protein [Muribaculaceae bacterium]
MKRLLSLIFSAAAVASLSAASLGFTYDTFKGIQQKYGNGKSETISVAVFITPDLAGRKITGLEVPVYAQPDKVFDLQGWTSTTLEYEQIDGKSFNVPDGVVADGVIGDDNILRVSFAEAVDIPATGIYVGYTFRSSTKLSGTSVATVEGNRKGECFYLGSRSKKKWTDLHSLAQLASAMTVSLDGDFPDEDAGVVCDNAVLGLDTSSMKATVVNHGTQPLKEVEYSYSSEIGASGTGKVTLDEPLEPVYGRGVEVDLPLAAFSESGNCSLSLTVTSVNGVPVSDSPAVEMPLAVQPFVPEFRPVVEEYTYLGCGYCPRGYVMLEQMKSLYGSKFMGISYHSSGNEHGAMACIDDALKPLANIGGYPAASLNRGADVDPSDIPSRWKSLVKNTTTCDVSARLEWTDDTQTELMLTGNARFLKDMTEHDYRIAYIVIGDGLSSMAWSQSNYYSSYEPTGIYARPFWDLFVGKDEHIRGLIFNDIALAMSDYKGVEGSLPESIEAGKEYGFSFTIDKASLHNIKDEEIVTDYNKVRCIAMIVDSKNGRVANCISTLYPNGGDPFPVRDDIDWNPVIEEDKESGVAPIIGNAEPVRTEYFGVSGVRIANPQKGDIVIKVETLSGGATRHSKIIF